MQPWTLRLRAGFALLLVVFMFGGPFYVQVLGGRAPGVRTWVMFRGFGLDICEANFYEVRDAGLVEIDRYALFGYDGLGDAPKSFRRLRTHREVGLHARKICRELSPSEVRVEARCATKSGWRTVYTGQRDACGPEFLVPPAPKKKGRH